MAYQFAGFFAYPAVKAPTELPPRAVWRDISSPFEGSGILLPQFIGKSPKPAEITEIANGLGITAASHWLFIIYDCWAGIDFVYGFGSVNGGVIGPVEDSALDTVEDSYKDLMAQFGVSVWDAVAFPAFERGFWGAI